eukprot:834929_1
MTTESNGSEMKSDSKDLTLEYKWTLWYTAPASGGGWNNNYKQIAEFSTIEDFWRLFNNISPPSLLDVGSSYHLFKHGVKPAWEDEFNENGGSWAFKFQPNKQKGKQKFDHHDQGPMANTNANYAWYHCVLNMVGNNFKNSEHICGLVIMIKKAGRGKIELWLKEANQKSKVIDIGTQFKEFCGAARKKNVEIEFMSFASQLKGRSVRFDKIKL